jgi:prolipoprotein diacylglyceryl transferase
MLILSVNWDPSPIIFEIGPLAIRWYGLMFVIAFLLGIHLEKTYYKRDGVNPELVDTLFIYTALATLIGARLGEVFFYSWDYYKDHLTEIFLPIRFHPFRVVGFRGLASHGAAIGIIVAMFLFKRKILPSKSVLWILDRVILTVPIGGAFVRIGNLMNSEIVGKYTGTDYGFIFRRLGDTAPRHPTQLYESAAYVLISIILWMIYWKTDKRLKEGYLFGVFMILLWTARFIIEFFKEVQVDERATWTLNTGQLLSIPMILVGILLMWKARERN